MNQFTSWGCMKRHLESAGKGRLEYLLPPGLFERLIETLKRKERFSVLDVGCGPSFVAEELLKHDCLFRYLGIDNENGIVEAFWEELEGALDSLRMGYKVECFDARFEVTVRPKNQTITLLKQSFVGCEYPEVDLVVASNSLPFCAKVNFPGVWHKLINAVAPGGYFVVTLWNPQKIGHDNKLRKLVECGEMTFHTDDEVMELIQLTGMRQVHMDTVLNGLHYRIVLQRGIS